MLRGKLYFSNKMNKPLKNLLLFILIAGIIEFFGIYLIVLLTYNEEGDYSEHAKWLFSLMEIFSFVLFFPLSFIEHIFSLAGHEIRYSSSNKGTIFFFGIYFINLIVQFFMLHGIKILWKRIRLNRK